MKAKEIKAALLKICFENVENRLSRIKQALSDIIDSLLEESRSTAGDKHETGRAMLDIERENISKQLLEVEILFNLLKKIDIQTKSDYARLGSLVKTEKGIYFISISIGAIALNKKTYICIALNSPMGQALRGKKKDEEFSFNNEAYKVLLVS